MDKENGPPVFSFYYLFRGWRFSTPERRECVFRNKTHPKSLRCPRPTTVPSLEYVVCVHRTLVERSLGVLGPNPWREDPSGDGTGPLSRLVHRERAEGEKKNTMFLILTSVKLVECFTRRRFEHTVTGSTERLD